MSTTLDQRIDELLGDEITDTDECPVFLEMSEATAAVLVEGLRWALYGGAPPPGGRRALLVTLDAITAALADHIDHDTTADPQTYQQGCSR